MVHTLFWHTGVKHFRVLAWFRIWCTFVIVLYYINKIFDIQENTVDLGGRAKSLIVSLTHSFWHDVAGPQQGTGNGLGLGLSKKGV